MECLADGWHRNWRIEVDLTQLLRAAFGERVEERRGKRPEAVRQVRLSRGYVCPAGAERDHGTAAQRLGSARGGRGH